MVIRMKMMDRMIKAFERFAISYAFVIIIYVLISIAGIFDPLGNEMALQLMCVCLVIAVLHLGLGFLPIKSERALCFLYFVVEAMVVMFMGFVVFDFFVMSITFFLYLGGMLVAVFVGTYLISYHDDWKKAKEINEIIRRNQK